MKIRFFTFIAIAAIVMTLNFVVSAQAKKQNRNSRIFEMIQDAKQGRGKLEAGRAARIREVFAEPRTEAPETGNQIAGAWNCQIAESDTGLPPFEALQTFSADGNFIETSSLLGLGGEGPAHGVYERKRRNYALTFELFVFDPATGEPVGRVRVRAAIRMTSSNTFEADSAVDFIEPSGAVIEDIDGGPFAGSRLIVRGL